MPYIYYKTPAARLQPCGSCRIQPGPWIFSLLVIFLESAFLFCLPSQFSVFQVADYQFDPESEQTVNSLPENPAFPSVSLCFFAFAR